MLIILPFLIAALRGSHHDFANSASNYGGVGQASNVAVHDAPLPSAVQSNAGRDHLPSSNVNVSSSGAIEGGRRAEGRGPVSGGGGIGGGGGGGGAAIGMGNGEGHPAERQSFGQKLVNILTCRCG